MRTRSSLQAEQVPSHHATHSTQFKSSAMRALDVRDIQSVQRKAQDTASHSSAVSQLKLLQAKMAAKADVAQRVEDEEPVQAKFDAVQRVEEEEPIQGKFAVAQRVEDEEPVQGKFAAVQRVEEEEPIQGKFAVAQRLEDEEPVQAKFGTAQLEERVQPNNTGLPNQLKAGIESLSGMSMDHVKVHYNSSQPAQLNAHAYAQGSEIHVAPGQEQHLPHEAWHVVQQAQGRVRPTTQMKQGVPVNDDAGLEIEADVMGDKAASLGIQSIQTLSRLKNSGKINSAEVSQLVAKNANALQFVRTAPAITGGAAITGGPVNAVNRDIVAPGPTNVDAYTIRMNVAVPNHDAAVAAIRTEYTSIGQGFAAPGAGVTGTFLYGTGLRNRCNADRPTASVVYDSLLAAGAIGAHVAPVPTPQQKQQHLLAQAPRAELNPANLEHLRNNVAMRWHDPIEANIQAPYGGAGAVLETRVDFTEGQKGYVSRVQSHGSDATIEDRPNYAGEFPRVDPRSAGLIVTGANVVNPNAIPTYSNVHHTATNESAGTQIGRLGAADTLAHHEAGIDAITKVVAEGGRFQCVAALGNNITNDTKFYTRDGLDPGPITVKYIEFRQLWTRWTSGFGGAYGIPNNVVRNYIDAERPGVVTVIPNNEADIPNVCPAPNVDLT